MVNSADKPDEDTSIEVRMLLVHYYNELCVIVLAKNVHIRMDHRRILCQVQ